MGQNDFTAAMQQSTSKSEGTQKLINTNAKFVCPECGQGLIHNLNDCPICGCPKEHLKSVDYSTRTSPTLESSNNFHAELIVNSLATVVLSLGIVLGFFALLGGIYAIVEAPMGEAIGAMIIVMGFLLFLICLIAWAVIRLLVNVSYRLTKIDNKQK